MSDIFNLGKINKQALNVNTKTAKLASLCEEYVKMPTNDKGELMVEAVVDLEIEIESLKKEIASMVNNVDSDEDIHEVTETENGLRIED